MGKKGEDADASVVTMEKKSKKNKNEKSDLKGDSVDGKSHVETDRGLPNEKNDDTHSEKKKKKKKKSESNVEGVENEEVREKGNLVNDGDLPKKDKKKKRKRDSSEDGVENEERREKGSLVNDGDLQKKDKKKKRKRDFSKKVQIEEKENDTIKKKKISGENLDTDMNEIMTEESTPETQNDAENSTKQKKKTKVKGSKLKKNTSGSVENSTDKAKPKAKSKKVSFSSDVEVFPSSETEPKNQTTEGDGLVRGKRFTPEEDEIIKEAVHNYIEVNNLGDDGLNMVLNVRSHKGMKNCWREIATCIPYRPHLAVYCRAHILFERSETRTWTTEEKELLFKLYKKHGPKWKEISLELGKHRFHVKDTWRRLKLENLKGGRWSQDEYQTVHDLVNLDLRMKLHSEKKSKHGMLRDNIPWKAISEKLTTRTDANLCLKWYSQLTSSLVAEKKWRDADDYWMIGELYKLDVACIDDVEWDDLLEHRPGYICRKRWDQMVKHIDDYGSKTFVEQVEILAKRYAPDLAEIREDWDNKPVVP